MSTATVRAFVVTREAKYADSTDPDDDAYLLVDGQRVGGTYWCGADYIPKGREWASWGPAGLLYNSAGFPSREAAEAAQVREYATNPDHFDRINAEERALLARDEAERQARQDAREAEWEAEQLRRRGHTDEPGPTVWTVPAYHARYAPLPEVEAVSAWLKVCGVGDVSALHPMRVEQRADRLALVYETPNSLAHLAMLMGSRATVEGQKRAVETWVATVTTPPPIATPDRPDLHTLVDEHSPVQYPLLDYGFNTWCGACCTAARTADPDRRPGTTDGMVLFPCDVVTAAIAATPARSGWADV